MYLCSKPRGRAESNPRSSDEKVSLHSGLRPLDNARNQTNGPSNTCCLNARVFWARAARWRLHSSGMTYFRHVLGLSMRRRCCLRHFLLIVPLLWLPRLVSCRSS